MFPYEVNQVAFTTKLSIEVAYTNRVKLADSVHVEYSSTVVTLFRPAACITKLVIKTLDNGQKELKTEASTRGALHKRCF